MALKFWKYVFSYICTIPLTKVNVSSFVSLSPNPLISVLRYCTRSRWGLASQVHWDHAPLSYSCHYLLLSVGSPAAPGSLLSWAKGSDSVSDIMLVSCLLIFFPELFVRYIRQGVSNDVTVEKSYILQIIKVSWTYFFFITGDNFTFETLCRLTTQIIGILSKNSQLSKILFKLPSLLSFGRDSSCIFQQVLQSLYC